MLEYIKEKIKSDGKSGNGNGRSSEAGKTIRLEDEERGDEPSDSNTGRIIDYEERINLGEQNYNLDKQFTKF